MALHYDMRSLTHTVTPPCGRQVDTTQQMMTHPLPIDVNDGLMALQCANCICGMHSWVGGVHCTCIE